MSEKSLSRVPRRLVPFDDGRDLEDYRDEVSNARIWAGFHYRFSTEVGKDMGKKIGELTIATQLRPRK